MFNANPPRLAKFATAIPTSVSQSALRRFVVAACMLFVLASSGIAGAGGADSQLAFVVNLNTATIEELKLLPGVGESRAAAIVTRRNEQGGFTSVDELMEIKGVGPSLMKRLRPHLTLEGETTAGR